MGTQPRENIDFGDLDEFKLRVTGKESGPVNPKDAPEFETEIIDVKTQLIEAMRNRFPTESETVRSLGHALVLLLEKHDPEKDTVNKIKLQKDFSQVMLQIASETILPKEKELLSKQRDTLIEKLDLLDLKINSEYSRLKKIISEFREVIQPEQYDAFLAGFVAEYTYAKACDLESYTIHYSTDTDDRIRKVDWWVRSERENDKGEEEIYAVQVKTMRIPGMSRDLVTIRSINDLNIWLKTVNDALNTSYQVNQYNKKGYIDQLEKIRGVALTLFRNCVSVKSLTEEGKRIPAIAKPALLIIPGEITRFDKSTGLPAKDYVQTLRDYLPEMLEEVK